MLLLILQHNMDVVMLNSDSPYLEITQSHKRFVDEKTEQSLSPLNWHSIN